MATAIHQGLRLYYQHLAISTTLALFLSMGCIEVPQKDETGAIRIGALLPFTGEQAASGFNLERPLLMAVDVINEAGGIAGKEVVLIAEDSNAMFKEVENWDLNKEIVTAWIEKEDLQAVIGPMIPELSKRLGSAFRKAEVIHLSGTVNAHSNLEATLTCSFNFLPSFKQLGQALAARMVEDGITTAGLIYLTDDYGEKLADQISSEFTSRDGKITDISATQLGKLSYVPDITNALANSPEGLVLVSYPKTGSDIVIDSMMSTMKRPQWYFSPSLRVSDFIVNVPPGQLEGAVGVAPGLGDRAQVFRELYESLWSGSPLLDGYYYYDSILALSLAMAAAARENNGTPTWKAICENMQAVSAVGLKVDWRNMAEGFKAIANGEDVDYDGLAGPLSLDDQGDLVDGWLELWRIHDNKIITDSRHELTQ